MAIDNTPPRLKLIVTIAVITVITLFSINFVFNSYYATMTDEATREKMAPTKDKDDQHKAEALALSQAAMPLDKAAAQFASGRPDSISPQQSDDVGAVTGWSKLPHPAPVPVAHDAPAVSADAGALMAGDGGVALGADGGAAPLGADGGAAMPNAGEAGKPATNADPHGKH